MEILFFSILLCITGLNVGQQMYPYVPYVHTFPVQPSVAPSQQWPRFSFNGQPYSKQSESVAYQIITITDYSTKGTQGSQLTTKLSNPVDISKLFRTPFGTKTPNDFPFLYGQSKSVPKQVVTFGTRYDLSPNVTPPKAIPFGTFQQEFYNYKPSKTLPKQPIVPNQFGSGIISGIGSSSFNVKNSTRSFGFPSSEDLDDIWGNTLDGASDKEKTVGERSASFRQTKKFVQAALDSHNAYRKKHKVSALTYNGQIAKVAQAWASKLIGSLAQGGRLQHRPNNKYGENLWMGRGYKFNDEEAVNTAVKAWYDEIRIYKPYFGREPSMSNFAEYGHFTQVVWKNTARLGMGIARKNGTIVVVANYDPPGNYKGQYVKNVKKP